MLGNIERVDRRGVQGWVRDEVDPSSPVSLVVSVNDEVVSRVLANVYRQDLEQAGLGNGRHGFLLKLDGLPPTVTHTVRISREDDKTEMPGSPVIIPPTLNFDVEMQDHLATMLAEPPTRPEQLIMDKKSTSIAILAITAAVLVLVDFAARPAAALMTIKDRDFSLVTARTQQNGDTLYIMDNRTGAIAVYSYDPASRDVRPRVFGDISTLFVTPGVSAGTTGTGSH